GRSNRRDWKAAGASAAQREALRDRHDPLDYQGRWTARRWSRGGGGRCIRRTGAVRGGFCGSPRYHCQSREGASRYLQHRRAERNRVLRARISRLSASKQKLSSVGKFHALEDAITIRRRTPVFVDDVRTIRDQAAEFSEGTGPIDGRHTVTRSQQSNLCAMADREGIRYHDQTTIRLACLCSNNEFELGPVVNGCDDRFHAKERSSGFEWAQVI